MKKLLTLAILVVFASISFANDSKQRIAGAGPSTKIVQLFVNQLAHQPEAAGYQFAVPPNSTKHAGGIKNSDQFLFGRTGRPLKSSEKTLGKEEIFLARIPIAFASGTGVQIDSLTLTQLEAIYTGEITHWNQLGGPNKPIELLGREPTEALYSVLIQKYPFFKEASFQKVLKNDTQVINLLKGGMGSHALGFGARPNLKASHIIEIEGLSAGVSLGLVYDLKNKNHPLVKAVKAYAASESWAQVISTQTEALPPN
jgi:ABC-type phosphate transport system substrate-binding protein